MKGEQLEFMKVIEFPKNKNIEEQKKKDKLEFVRCFLEKLVEEGFDFNIVIDEKATDKFFEISKENQKGSKRKYSVLTSNVEAVKTLSLNPSNIYVYKITGNEL